MNPKFHYRIHKCYTQLPLYAVMTYKKVLPIIIIIKIVIIIIITIINRDSLRLDPVFFSNHNTGF